MKKITLLLALFIASIASAQTTFEVLWKISATGTDLTLVQGDTVKWIWDDALSHTVTSQAGSQETFDSGTQTGMGLEFEVTFTEVGTNPYLCEIHPGTMTGTITVEQALGVDEKFYKNIQIFPNPAEDVITVFSLYKLNSYVIHDIYGKRVSFGEGDGNYTFLNMADLKSGVYFITLQSEDLQATKRIIRK